ncbi:MULTISPECIES: M15 family metallopeptidase [Faecalicatena]
MSMKMNRKVKKALIFGAVMGAAVGILITFAAANKAVDQKAAVMAKTESKLKKENKALEEKIKQQKTIEAAANLSKEGADNWELILVNNQYPLDAKYKPELKEISEGYSVDARILEDTKKMLSDAEGAGLKMHLVSAYRSPEDQKEVFNTTMQDWINQGDTYLDAYNETKKSVALPGHSEHATGLALDIVSEEYQDLDDKQADTEESKWLAENCYKYGFILRYPTDKSDITGIVYEPWHYRYVGKDAAKKIMDKGITLEEYLGAA